MYFFGCCRMLGRKKIFSAVLFCMCFVFFVIIILVLFLHLCMYFICYRIFFFAVGEIIHNLLNLFSVSLLYVDWLIVSNAVLNSHYLLTYLPLCLRLAVKNEPEDETLKDEMAQEYKAIQSQQLQQQPYQPTVVDVQMRKKSTGRSFKKFLGKSVFCDSCCNLS